MEVPVADGPLGSLPSQSQGGRREWRKVSDVPNGRETPGNQTRPNQLTRPRPGNVGQRRTSQNGRLFHAMSEHPSDSDPHGGDGGGGHLMGGRVSPQELSSQNIGHENVLYDEVCDAAHYLISPTGLEQLKRLHSDIIITKADDINSPRFTSIFKKNCDIKFPVLGRVYSLLQFAKS